MLFPLRATLLKVIPERVLWGTDWPHPNKNNYMHDDGQRVDIFPHIAATEELQCTKAQVALAWVLQQHECIHAIPGTTNLSHLKDNVAAQKIRLSASQLQTLADSFAPQKISGPRYPQATQLEIDTEEF
ncbi:aldo/keto reductase [Alteromonas sp. KUL106]|uniref:aldo/keto reductase n=1 Tax=Alteromonas sp. KUL106 TaxID=2480799 RepID=UPI0012E5C340|nr:aldo/keto reductase [Alteromonas sp. KUL106]GFD67114.1 hypothetical protein KUL106_03770 [Alteromonas sp. KUL106]